MKLSRSLLAVAYFSLPSMAHAAHDYDPELKHGDHEHGDHTHDADHDHEEDHGHDEEGAFDVDAYQLTLKGEQAFGDACYLGVVEQGTSTDGVFFAWLETSFEHDGEGPGRLYATFDSSNPSRLTASSESGSRISVELNPGFTSLKEAFRYAVTWRHENHNDTGFCSNLTLIHEAVSNY